MGLFSDRSVIIIGAGASVPFGLPTGLTQIDDTVKALSAKARRLSSYEERSQMGEMRILPHMAPTHYSAIPAHERDGVPSNLKGERIMA